MDIWECVNGFIIPLIEIIVSSAACFYTYKTYRQSRIIQNTLSEEKRFNWNKNELENVFSTIPISSIDSFFQHPNIISDTLWKGLGAVDLSTFQFDGKEKGEIELFFNKLYDFCLLNYKQIPSKHWKFYPLADNEPYNAEKEWHSINELESNARKIRPLFDKVKNVLLKYRVNLREINAKALEFYYDKYESSELSE